MQTKTIRIDGLTIYYREGGSQNDPTLLYLDGLSFGSSLKKRLIKSDSILDRFADAYHVIALEYPSFMRSDIPAGIWEINDYSSFIHEFVRSLQLRTPIIAMGHSFGAMLLVNYAALFKDDLSQLIISAPPVKFSKSIFHKKMFGVIEGLCLRLFDSKTVPARLKRLLPKYVLSWSQTDLGNNSPNDYKRILKSFSTLLSHDYTDALGTIDLPTIVLGGKYDIFVPYQHAVATQAEIRNSILMTYGLTHFKLPGKFIDLKEQLRTG
ncbi:hypothetical protein AUK40_01390 [Candidatus Wirthbacteria bacterium CG2_30_54_11]|uniref:Serine aminopeptidase S33 domain-containing protein n=1 Tax=Candidatus Wirthbacteria bacterium CG2_30_54_11 TaxID=1817892 RepID=A0A1J5IVV3_9BACT|nr:MAG: hypothetical protein AUK40_01390 [Candidatus Wirthbacteria bacterium CG2_30_54_11]